MMNIEPDASHTPDVPRDVLGEGATNSFAEVEH
ncbi:hypothetical protein Krac_7167 [Ktedonobacter racemifer DSM 44963]|uniref:Uncharacterized protein n=1 Tax=Ktedonobacter racemifer DSM 44963 TaxID=485913 RepID=D6TR39_KTERA|nr:hypothetical protein Krac_7167 [Ktedonobacter racemifer DSM 44963]